MPVYQVTYKSGAQQFFEMDIEDSMRLGRLLENTSYGQPPGPLNRVRTSSTSSTPIQE